LWLLLERNQHLEKEQIMAEVLKGNFTPRRRVVVDEDSEDLTTQFEREALKRLGGSIAFVSKKNFLYGVTKDDGTSESTDGS
jgi:hypothetical protein